MTGNPFGWGTNLLATLARPSSGADPRILGSVDDWMQDCSSPAAQDGTQFSAEQANEMVANVRALLRANGFRADGVTPVVTEDHSDGMLAAALLNALQRRRPNYCVDTGAADAIVANPAPTPAELVDGMEFLVKVANPNATTAPTANIGGTGAKTIKRVDGSAVAAGDVAAVFTTLRYDKTADVWKLAAGAAGAAGGPGAGMGQWIVQVIYTSGYHSPYDAGFHGGLAATASQIQTGTWPIATPSLVGGFNGVNSANGGALAGIVGDPHTGDLNGTLTGNYELETWAMAAGNASLYSTFLLFWTRKP